jgi:arabinofuranan 3-O-arabinosyltransferase
VRLPTWLRRVGSRPARPPVSVTLLLVVLAAVPAFTAAPGLMPADSKLYLYLNPGRLITDALWSFDPRQFAGWVPHQHITFLWPSGPWFQIMDLLGLPDWVAHRAWLTVIFGAAGLGVVWAARLLGLTWVGATIAAVIYQLSPYTLAYVSRTSVMLLPWAGLGWILALTVLSGRYAAAEKAIWRWRHPALMALVIFTVGSVNPTALAMIAPAPVMWLVHEVRERTLSWRLAAAVAGKITVLSVGVSAWWMAMVMIQRRHGADVLGFSETLEDVSATATATEVLRGLGYWLFYVRDTFGPATTASGPYLTSTLVILVSFLIVLTGFWALATTRWAHRSFAAALIVIGTVFAVGVHPIGDSSPVMGLLADTEIALALRSSTRAIPMLLLGLALLIGARLPLVKIRSGPRWLGDLLPVVLVTTISLINLPAWWGGGFVDPDLRRDSDPPAAWSDAAARINARPEGYRVLQIPGAEFGSYRWGHTVDQPLVALIDRGVITRDLLPLGSSVAMDLVFSLDDRIQQGVIPHGAISAVARLLGADLIWLTNDLAHERYRTVRPETLISVLEEEPGVRRWASFGEPESVGPDRQRVDPVSLSKSSLSAAVPPVMLWEVEDAVPVIRAGSEVVVIAGSADGIIDAAGAGMIDGSERILYAAVSSPEQIAAADMLIITDSARARPRHWRSSRDVVGATESVDARLIVLDPIIGDRRLGFGHGPFVTAEQWGQVRATASSYGEQFAFLPEMRPAMAIDGDPTTAWRVGGNGNPVGQRLRLYFDEPVDHLQLLQPVAGRFITSVRIEVSDDTPGSSNLHTVEVALGADSRRHPGQRVELPVVEAGRSMVDIVITGVSTGPPHPVGFAEVGPFATVEYLQIPNYGPHPETRFVFTRDRVEPRDLWRTDPETLVSRRFTVPGPDTGGQTWQMELDVRIDQRASDATLAYWMNTAAIADSRLQGAVAARGHSAVDGDPDTAWVSEIQVSEIQVDDVSDGTAQPSGPALRILGLEGVTDQIRITQPEGQFSRITEIEIDAESLTQSTGPLRVAVTEGAVSGMNEISLPVPIGPGPVEIRVTGIEPRLIGDQRYGQMLTAPVAITEINFGVPLTTAPPQAIPECITDLLWLNEQPIPLRVQIDSGRAEPCDSGGVNLGSGDHLLRSSASEGAPGLVVNQIRIQPVATRAVPAQGRREVTVALLDQTRLSRTVEITNCDPRCWVVLGEGHNSAWRAEVAGRSLGDPVVVDGGFNGWLLEPEDPAAGPVRVDFRWTAQTPLTVALGISGVFIFGCGWLGRPRRGRLPAVPKMCEGSTPQRHRLVADSDLRLGVETVPIVNRLTHTGIWAVMAAAFVGPLWAIVAIVISVPRWWGIRMRIAEIVALSGVALSVMIVIALQIRRAPLANMAWPEAVGDPHQLALFGVVSVITVAVFTEGQPVESPKVAQ